MLRRKVRANPLPRKAKPKKRRKVKAAGVFRKRKAPVRKHRVRKKKASPARAKQFVVEGVTQHGGHRYFYKNRQHMTLLRKDAKRMEELDAIACGLLLRATGKFSSVRFVPA